MATDLQKATGLVDTSAANSANLNRVLQLTGQSLTFPEQPCAGANVVKGRGVSKSMSCCEQETCASQRRLQLAGVQALCMLNCVVTLTFTDFTSTATNNNTGPLGLTASLLSNNIPLRTGLADPVYAEAHMTVHQYKIVLDVMATNRMSETPQNLCLDL